MGTVTGMGTATATATQLRDLTVRTLTGPEDSRAGEIATTNAYPSPFAMTRW